MEQLQPREARWFHLLCSTQQPHSIKRPQKKSTGGLPASAQGADRGLYEEGVLTSAILQDKGTNHNPAKL